MGSKSRYQTTRLVVVGTSGGFVFCEETWSDGIGIQVDEPVSWDFIRDGGWQNVRK